MADLQSTNVTGTLCVNGVAIGGGKDFKFYCVTGSTTWTPPSGLVTGDGVLDLTMVGGGGGGGVCCTNNPGPQQCGGGGAGGSGGVGFQGLIQMTSSNDTCTITIGYGGAGASGSTGITGCNGGNTIFNTASLAACGAMAAGGGGGFNCWGNAGGRVMGRNYRAKPALGGPTAGAGGPGLITAAAPPSQDSLNFSYAPPCACFVDNTPEFAGFGVTFQSDGPRGGSTTGRNGSGIGVSQNLGSGGHSYGNRYAHAPGTSTCGPAAGTYPDLGQSYGAGGHGICGDGIAQSGSAGIAILKWAE